MTHTRISDLEGEPVIGETYLVPCVRDRRLGWHPVIGPAHSDPEFIGQRHEHWHYDARFLTDGQLQKMAYGQWGFEPWKAIEEALAVIQFVAHAERGGAIEEMPLRCLRPMPEFMTRVERTGQIVPWLPELEDAFESEHLACLRCPHKGMPLNGLPQTNGMVVCNGHGLRWDLETGEMIRRTKAVQTDVELS